MYCCKLLADGFVFFFDPCSAQLIGSGDSNAVLCKILSGPEKSEESSLHS